MPLWHSVLNYLVANYPRIVSGLVHPSDLHGISRVNPLITGVITCYNPLTIRGMSHQVSHIPPSQPKKMDSSWAWECWPPAQDPCAASTLGNGLGFPRLSGTLSPKKVADSLQAEPKKQRLSYRDSLKWMVFPTKITRTNLTYMCSTTFGLLFLFAGMYRGIRH